MPDSTTGRLERAVLRQLRRHWGSAVPRQLKRLVRVHHRDRARRGVDGLQCRWIENLEGLVRTDVLTIDDRVHPVALIGHAKAGRVLNREPECLLRSPCEGLDSAEMTVIPPTRRFEERSRSTQETQEVEKLGAYVLTRWRHIVAFRAELPPLSPQFGGVRSALVGEGRRAPSRCHLGRDPKVGTAWAGLGQS